MSSLHTNFLLDIYLILSSSSFSSWITGKNLQAATVENFFFGGTLFNTLRKCLFDVFRYSFILIFSPLSSIGYSLPSSTKPASILPNEHVYYVTSYADILFTGGTLTLVYIVPISISYISSFNSFGCSSFTCDTLLLFFRDFKYDWTSLEKSSLCLVFMNLVI